MRRVFLAAIVAAVLCSGCSSDWTEERGQKFVADCISKLQLDDLMKKQAICECWYEKTSSTFSYEVASNPTADMKPTFIAWGKECSKENGVVARNALPQAAPTGERAQPPAAGSGKSPTPGS